MSWKMPVAAEPNRQPASSLFLGGKAAAEGSNQRLGSRPRPTRCLGDLQKNERTRRIGPVPAPAAVSTAQVDGSGWNPVDFPLLDDNGEVVISRGARISAYLLAAE
jgi:hypothetical protein